MKIEIKNLEFSYDSRKILKGISLNIEKGKMTSILGPNGVGKTTLFRCILGNLKGYNGLIKLESMDIRDLSSRKLASLVAYVPQCHYPTFNYSVIDMVLMGTAHEFSTFSLPGKKQLEQAFYALEELDIANYAKKNFAKLSGGEQQLVLIARALAQQSKFLLMDEPTSNLDYGNQMVVLEKVKELTKKGYTVLLSIHNPQQALMFSDNILAIYDGKIIADGPPNKVVNSELLRKLYNTKVKIAYVDEKMVILPSF